MNKMSRLLLVLTLFFTTFAFGQNAEEAITLLENESGFGIKAASMGNAFTGIADDYSAIYWNPGGLAQIKNQQLYGSLNHLKLRTEATYLGAKTTYDQGFTKFQSFGYVYPFPVRRGSLVLALGYQRIKDLNHVAQFTGFNTTSNDLAFSIYNDLGYAGLTMAFDNNFQLTQSIKEEGHLAQWSIGSAMDLSPDFSAGAALNFIGGKSDYRLKYLQEDTKGMNGYDIYDNDNRLIERFDYNYYQLEQMVSTDYSGIELKLGGLWRPNEQLRVGGNMTLPMTLSIEESWTYSDELSYDVYSIDEDITYRFVEPYDSVGRFDYEIKVPFKFDVGFSYTYKNLLLAASLRYVDWTQTKIQRSDNTPSWYESYFTKQNDRIPTLFRDVTSYSVGGEVSLFGNAVKLRGGYRLVPSPFKDLSKRVDKKYYSAGIGIKVDANTSLDLAFVRGYYEAQKYYRYDWDDDQTIPPMVTKEKYQIDKLQVGISYNF